MSDNQLEKPSPVRDEQSAPFFDGAAQGMLMIKHCEDCGAFGSPTEVYCTHCIKSLEWVLANGKGTVFNWSIVHQAFHPGFAEVVPYIIGTVKLEEGPRLMTRYIGIDAADMRTGLPVQAQFLQWPNGEYLPVFTVIS